MLHFLIDGSNSSILPLTRLPSLNQVPFCPVMVEKVESKYSYLFLKFTVNFFNQNVKAMPGNKQMP